MMRAYIVTYFDRNGGVEKQDALRFASDDAAIDAVGESPHRHAIEIKDGERLVARFPPWLATP
ncbi:MAG: hypothetical protein A4S17_00695 [Proteobacteria bacterium HN_bin10]|nr:MAG: hypothetical protein A4S17_00695 [Proteobacteria bacterium HN_bin10]